MVMLYFSFLDIRMEKSVIKKIHFVILLTIIFSPLLFYSVTKFFDGYLAEAVFITSFSPTAIAAPVIISLKKGKVEFVIFSLLLSNIVISLLTPFMLPLIVHTSKNISVGVVLFPVLFTISIPMVLAQATKFLLPKIWKKFIAWKDLTFYILVLNIYLAVSDATMYIRAELTSKFLIVTLIAVSSAMLCILYFYLGKIIGGNEYGAEASQSLGQKNNAFTLWISLTFIGPLAALGPIFYVLFQNIYITWQLSNHRKNL